jgi:hypothetical protein
MLRPTEVTEEFVAEARRRAAEPGRPNRETATAIVAAIAAIAGAVFGGLVVYFIAQHQQDHADRARLRERREAAYMAFVDHGQTMLEALPAIKPGDLKTASQAISASRQVDDDLTTIQFVGTPAAISAAFGVWRAASDALAQVLSGKLPGSDAVNLQIIAMTRTSFLEVARADIGSGSK